MTDTPSRGPAQSFPRKRRYERRRPLRMNLRDVEALLTRPDGPEGLRGVLSGLFLHGDWEATRDWCRRTAVVLGQDHPAVRPVTMLTRRLDDGERQRDAFHRPVEEVYSLRLPVGDVLYARDDPLSRQFFDALMPDDRLHEPGLVAYLCKSLTDKDVFVDIGAHTGYLACIAGVAGASVITMEFQQPLNRVIERNLALNGIRRANVLELAASDRDGVSAVPRYNAQFGAKLYDEQVARQAEPFPPFGANIQLVPTMRLDTLFAGLGEPPSLVKIDAEGFELRILKGAERLIAARRTTFLVEYHCAHVGVFGSDADELDALFPAAAWRVFHLRDRGMTELDRDGLRRLIAAHGEESNPHFVFRPR